MPVQGAQGLSAGVSSPLGYDDSGKGYEALRGASTGQHGDPVVLARPVLFFPLFPGTVPGARPAPGGAPPGRATAPGGWPGAAGEEAGLLAERHGRTTWSVSTNPYGSPVSTTTCHSSVAPSGWKWMNTAASPSSASWEAGPSVRGSRSHRPS